MGKLRNGILDGFTGKVGTVVGSFWKGIATMRAYNATPTQSNTPAQLEQRAKFSLMIKLLAPMIPFLRVGFKSGAIKKSGINAAMQYNLANAITGTYPAFDVDFSKLLVCKGKLVGAANAEVTSSTAGEIEYTWEDNSDGAIVAATDKALLLLYNPTKNRVTTVVGGNARTSGSQSVPCPANWTGDEVQCFIAFGSENLAVISNSEFAGGIIVS